MMGGRESGRIRHSLKRISAALIINYMADLLKILIKESLAEAVTRIRNEHFDGAALDGCTKSIDALQRCQVRLNGVDLRVEAPKIFSRLRYLCLIGCYDQIKVVLGTNFSKLVPNSGGCAGHDG
jgi:hypothetical protein